MLIVKVVVKLAVKYSAPVATAFTVTEPVELPQVMRFPLIVAEPAIMEYVGITGTGLLVLASITTARTKGCPMAIFQLSQR